MSDKVLKQYTVIHDHEYGTDRYKFATDRKELQDFCSASGVASDDGEKLERYLLRVPLLADILNALDINFEPDREESIAIEEDDIIAVYIP